MIVNNKKCHDVKLFQTIEIEVHEKRKGRIYSFLNMYKVFYILDEALHNSALLV